MSEKNLNRESQNSLLEKVISTLDLKLVKTAQKNLTKKKTLTGHAECINLIGVERYGGAVASGVKNSQDANSVNM
jgi:hypothetical protein